MRPLGDFPALQTDSATADMYRAIKPLFDYNDIFFPMELEPESVLRIPSVEQLNMRLLD